MGLLTVAMPVYNAMPFLPSAVESILGQRFGDFEFLIVDDGSTDGSREYLKALSDPRVRLYSEHHRGVTGTRNRLLELARGELCALMDADDISMPDRLATQIAFMQRRKDVVLLGTQIRFLTDLREVAASPFPMEHEKIVAALNQMRPVLCNSSCMFRTQSALRIGGYRLARGEDFDVFLRLSEVGLVANTAEVLQAYRIHLQSTFATQYSEHATYIAYAVACHRSRKRLMTEPSLDQFLHRWNNCGRTRRAVRKLDAWAALEFRRALMAYGEGRSLSGSARMIAAAICRPRSSVAQGLSRVKRLFSPADTASPA